MEHHALKTYKKPSLKVVLLSGLLVGTFDITVAIVQAGIGGTGPLRLLQYVASGVFGTTAFSGGALFAFYGLVFHYFITMCWTILFFLVYRKLDLLRYNRVITGIFYGIFIGLVMNFAVVPFSEVSRGPVRPWAVILAISILVVAIGLPLSFLAHRFYSSAGKN